MKAKELAEILLKNPEAKVTLSLSNETEQIFADEIIEVTKQGNKQVTIVADIKLNDSPELQARESTLSIDNIIKICSSISPNDFRNPNRDLIEVSLCFANEIKKLKAKAET